MGERDRKTSARVEAGEGPMEDTIEEIFSSIDEVARTTGYPVEYIVVPGDIAHEGGQNYAMSVRSALSNQDGKPIVLLVNVSLNDRLTQQWIATAEWTDNKPLADRSRLIPVELGEGEFIEEEVAIATKNLTNRLLTFVRNGGRPGVTTTIPQGIGKPGVATAFREQGRKPN